MTEEEWKAFDKSKGRLVYAPDSKSGRVVSWRIESACGVGATLSKGDVWCKDHTFAHYRQIMDERQKLEYEHRQEMEEKKKVKWKGEERTCVVCGKQFKPYAWNQIACSAECQRERNCITQRKIYQKKKEEADKRNLQRRPDHEA